MTGGIAPNRQGWLAPFGAKLSSRSEAQKHRNITEAVHAEDGKICMQILHAGRYGVHPFSVAPSAIKSAITPFSPWAMSQRLIRATIQDFANCAALAREAGYDGVEIMGSEGYLINQFIAPRTNKRTDDWGGSFENRIRFPQEVMRAVRAAAGHDFIVIFRISMLDLVEDGSTWEEVEQLALAIERAGATIINTGIGWHEARIPTIATLVPRGAYTWVTKRLMGKVGIPLITTNRINTPEKAEEILREGYADMVSMARPLLADPDFMRKAAENRADEINTCIACNQACLDHVFSQKTASCLLNPRACRETKFVAFGPATGQFPQPASPRQKIAVVGAGPAGLSAATEMANLGHEVHLFEASETIGGQFNLAKKIPGKEEFYETIRYFGKMLDRTGVRVHVNTRVEADFLIKEKFQQVVLATGIKPRTPSIPGIDHPKVMSYVDVLTGRKTPGQQVALIGAGGIAFDVATFLTHPPQQLEQGMPASLTTEWKKAGDAFRTDWGIDAQMQKRGGITAPHPETTGRRIWILQRSKGKPGDRLGKTTGWAHRLALKARQTQMMAQVEYLKIDDEGLHIQVGGQATVLPVDSVVICAGQEPLRDLYAPLQTAGVQVHLIGGAKEASELDAKRAIEEGLLVTLAGS